MKHFLTAFSLIISLHAFAADLPAAPSVVRAAMTPEEFRATGLTKLSPQELRKLDEWFVRFNSEIIDAGLKSGIITRPTAKAPPPRAMESQIEGEFKGWDGETVFILTNGQIWKQSAYAYHYHYAYRPRVLIYDSGSGYKLKVDGVSEEVSVRRLK